MDPKYSEPAYRAAMSYWTRHMRHHPWTCRRCAQPIPPGHRASWDLGHPQPYEPEHRHCNRAAGGRAGRQRTTQPASANW